MALFSCTKTNDIPDEEPQVKPEWRIKRVLIETHEIKLTLCRDTMTYVYDTLGRFSEIKYRLWGMMDHPPGFNDYYTHVGSDLRLEYYGNEERVHKSFHKDMYSVSSTMSTFTYDNAGKRLTELAMTDMAGNPGTVFKFSYNNGSNNPSGFTGVHYGGTSNDTTISQLTFTNGHLTKRINARHAGVNINTFVWDRNAAGNPTYSMGTGRYGTMAPDTMRKINLTWKPTTTPMLEKVKRIPDLYKEIINEVGSFYFVSQNELVEFDYFDLTSHNELLDSYHFTWNMYTIMTPRLKLDYTLDSNQLISKITGTIPGKPGTMEMLIEYEKIQ